MKSYLFNLTSVLLILLFLCDCSANSNEKTQSNPEDSQTESEWEHLYDQCGYLNGDQFIDSVVIVSKKRHEESDSENGLISIYFGNNSGGYNLFKTYYCEAYWNELGLYIHGDTLSCSGYGISYDFLYVDGDFKLVSYQSFTEGNPAYILDFNNNQMTFVVEPQYGIQETIHRLMDISNDKIPHSYSITDVFKEDFSKYIYYDDSFLYSKIEAFVKEINEEDKEDKENKEINSERIDNDTLLSFMDEIKYGEKTFALHMDIDKTDMTPTLWKIFETEMCAMLDKENKHSYNKVIDAYNARKEEWLKECDFEDEPYCYIVSYFINKIGKHNNLSTYNIGTFHNDQYSGRGEENERFVTYNKHTGELFTWDMIQKEDGLHTLMVEGLMKFYKSERVEDMCVKEKYQNGEYIPFPKNPPFIINDSLVLEFHRFEITDVWVAGWPCATIPLNKVKPYLTDEGKMFLEMND